ncbi:MAG: Xaa-Pro peptidase family protein [Acetobacterales bacterium]
MPLHFSREELAERRRLVTEKLAARGLDGLLMFRQESMYYLTGYDTFGYVFFQCLYLGADGRLVLLTRSPDLRQARYTSMIDDIRIWVDLPDADPARNDLLPILDEMGCRGGRLGVEWDAYGLTARNGQRLAAALDGFCALDDASELVTYLRVVKSPAEIACVRKAGELADAALAEAVRLAQPGAFEGDILAAMQGAVFRGDGDYPGNEFIIGSGPSGMLGRYQSGRRHLGKDDMLAIEFAGVFRHYHSCLWRTIKVGEENHRHRHLYDVSLECLLACEEAVRPGETVGSVFEAYDRTLQRHGFGADSRFNACGYSLGTTFSPNWMDWPMFYRGNPVILEPGMVFFISPGVRDDDAVLLGEAGETVLVTDTGCERLSSASLDYVRKP